MTILKRHLPAACLILACLFNAATARSDEFHYNNMIIGERAAGMGGAFTALANDTSGMYYNPAGLVHAQAKSLSASVNAYYSLSKKYSGAIAGSDLNRNYSAIVPNFFGVQQPVGRISLGFSYAVPEHAFENMDETFTDLPTSQETKQHYGDPNLRIARYVLNLNTEDSINEFGPSVAVKVSETMSLGLTLYVRGTFCSLKTNCSGSATDGTNGPTSTSRSMNGEHDPSSGFSGNRPNDSPSARPCPGPSWSIPMLPTR